MKTTLLRITQVNLLLPITLKYTSLCITLSQAMMTYYSMFSRTSLGKTVITHDRFEKYYNST